MGTTTEPRYTEVLCCGLGKEEYGINILAVQEIRDYESVTAIAKAPTHLKGVINLRGVIVPIIDLRIKFHLNEATYDAMTVVIIMNLTNATVGVVVDSVSDVVTLSADQIKPAPVIESNLSSDYLLGLATLDERMLILIDMEKLISAPDLAAIEKLAA